MIFFCIRAHLVRAQDAVGPTSGVPFSAHAWSAIEALWNCVLERVDTPSEPAKTTIENLEYYTRLLGTYVITQDDNEDTEDDDLGESSSDSEESDDDNIRLPDIGIAEGSPGTLSPLCADLSNSGNVR
jgi:hypothetical protein